MWPAARETETETCPEEAPAERQGQQVIWSVKDDGHLLVWLDLHTVHFLLVPDPAFSLESHRLNRSARSEGWFLC